MLDWILSDDPVSIGDFREAVETLKNLGDFFGVLEGLLQPPYADDWRDPEFVASRLRDVISGVPPLISALRVILGYIYKSEGSLGLSPELIMAYFLKAAAMQNLELPDV